MKMLNWGSEARPNKQVVRQFLMRDLGRRPNSIWMPSTGAQCVTQGLQSGVLQKDDPLILVERDFEIVKLIKHKKCELGLVNAVIHEGDLSSCPIPRMIDYAFIDLMGSFNQPIVDWLVKLVKISFRNLVVDIAVTLNWRNNNFMRTFARRLDEVAPELFDKLSLECALNSKWMVTPMALLSCALYEFDIMFERPIIYSDSRQSMLVFRIMDIRNGANPDYQWPALNVIMAARKEPKMEYSRQQNAAFKAWETRRLNKAKKEERSIAAKKAWVTRRANVDR